MTHLGLYVPEWKLVRRWSHIKLRFISYAYNHTYCQKNIKIFTFRVHRCRTPAVLSFYYKSTNKSFLSRNLFKADFSQNANYFHQEKNLFLSYDYTVIFSWCLCSFLSFGVFFLLVNWIWSNFERNHTQQRCLACYSIFSLMMINAG